MCIGSGGTCYNPYECQDFPSIHHFLYYVNDPDKQQSALGAYNYWLSNDDFITYICKRYDQCTNTFVKTFYGTILWLCKKGKHNRSDTFLNDMTQAMLELNKTYREQMTGNTAYQLDTVATINAALTFNQSTPLVGQAINNIITLIDCSNEDHALVLGETAKTVISHFKVLKTLIDFDTLTGKLYKMSSTMTRIEPHAAASLVESTIKIQQKRDQDTTQSIKQLAHTYRHIAQSAGQPLASIYYLQEAHRLYQQLKMEDEKEQTLQQISTLRQNIKLEDISINIDMTDIDNYINICIEQMTTDQLLQQFTLQPSMGTIDSLKDEASTMQNSSIVPVVAATIRLDDMGNAIDKASTDNEYDNFFFWQAVSQRYSLQVIILQQILTKALVSKKLTTDHVLNTIKKSWLNASIPTSSMTDRQNMKPLDQLAPSLQAYLNSIANPACTEHDWVMIIDSMTLKIEKMLRIIAMQQGIIDFKSKVKTHSTANVMQEILLDDIIGELRKKSDFDPMTLTLCKAVLCQNGFNIRNKVAHGMMALQDYNATTATMIFMLIMRLTTYQPPTTDETTK